MNDHVVKGETFGGYLDNLRQVARVWLPRMADDYYNAATKLRSSTDGGSALSTYQQDEYFHYEMATNIESLTGATKVDSPGSGPGTSAETWKELCTILEGAFGDTSNTYASVGDALGHAVDEFAMQDTEAGNTLNGLREDMEDIGKPAESSDSSDDEWTKEQPVYDAPEYDDPRDAKKE